jgi:hypothetical protein
MRLLILSLFLIGCGRAEVVSEVRTCTTTQVADGIQMSCPDGTTSFVHNGTAGPKGNPGDNGIAGKGCHVTSVVDGAIINCDDGTSAVILNGEDATPSMYAIDSTVDPCGKQTSFDEILIRLANGSLLAHYASGANQFLTYVVPGTYVTTDGSHCYFTIENDGSLSHEHN